MTARGDFWSRRKAAVASEQEAEVATNEAEIAARNVEALEERSDEDILAELDLKDPDTLEPGDDFAAFMKAAVPERIRRRALRKLWLSNPALANLDSLVDYGEDYTNAATVVENLSTTYQVGKGMLKHVLEMERLEKEAENGPVDDEIAEIDVDDEKVVELEADDLREADDADVVCLSQETEENTPTATLVPAAGTAEEYTQDKMPTRRRMRFAFG